ncbi:NAD(P)-binding protein [Gordonia amarae]|uniref:Protoporphyrinogen oxidase n=2 Tax=Gordonia amarae TaxID=36821 RepID=G7GVW7_9ACTN|nr:FAD-dependent oxidoreductase [Gordonia amarae]MCS3878820.1 oxygen-dependent protoporphyrinogen oxidase [Gordonia amarae]QHN17389.1 NAD(P)-binding protein [Gordonia amarae]QHN21915.1 NAD(P)-binding protein [Gordonia amarae]QHN30764.1 NAD(P)-binding protein [Gordonia amarae]QHN39541.1 NAD(P)-binding protein [Gordonia amarae]
MTRRSVAVVGGGVSGLTTAYRLRQALGADVSIDLYEAGGRLGGLLNTTSVGGLTVDVGAEAFIVRRPEVLELVRELGLADLVVSPTGRRPAIWSGGRLHPLPTPALMGVPATPDAVAGLVDPEDLARIAGEPDRPWTWEPGADPSVGDLIADRCGPSVVARSVDPMLGGVYSSLSGDIGLREALPALAARLDAGAPGVRAAVTDLITAGAGATGPVFGTLVGGYRVLVDALAAASGVRLVEAGVSAAVPVGDGWDVGGQTYDGVVLAVPAWEAARLLGDTTPELTTTLAAVEPAGSAVVSITLAPGTPVPDHSGVLVATGERLRAKAFTFSSQKWAHVADSGLVSVRASFGRYGEPVTAGDDELVRIALGDLDQVVTAAGCPAVSPRVVEALVQPWPTGLPRYAPGHLVRMSEALRLRPSRLVLTGSSYAGVGVPACVGAAGRAAADLVADLT